MIDNFSETEGQGNEWILEVIKYRRRVCNGNSKKIKRATS